MLTAAFLTGLKKVQELKYHGIHHHSNNDDPSEPKDNWSLKEWFLIIDTGAPSEKLVLGIPFYGRTFTLADVNNNQLRASISGPGQPGKFTKEPGFLAYNEICVNLIEGGWMELTDPVGSPYAVKNDQWVGYDTTDSIAVKMEYIRTRRLGGAMIWAIDLDDFRGICGNRYFQTMMDTQVSIELIG